jgi:hypothetical protein
MSDVVQALRDELVRLEQRIAEVPILEQRAAKIRELLAMYESASYGDDPSVTRGGFRRRTPSTFNAPPRAGVGAVPGSMAQRIVDGAADFLRRKRARAKLPEIVAALADAGVLPADATRDKYGVSSRLSRSPMFDGGRGQGYGLVEWTPADVAALVKDDGVPGA